MIAARGPACGKTPKTYEQSTTLSIDEEHNVMQDLWSRRRFLSTTTAAAGGSLLLSSWARAADADDPYAGFNVGLQSYTLRNFPIDKALDRKSTRLNSSHIQKSRMPSSA